MFVDNNDLIGKKAPELAHGSQWVNSSPLRLGHELRGHPVLVTFWTSTDLNSLQALPVLKAWHERYAKHGLMIVGVHIPDFSFERSTEYVARFLVANNIAFPVVLDNDTQVAQSFDCNYRPSFYLLDDRGIIRYVEVGEGEYFATEQLISELLPGSRMRPVERPQSSPVVSFHSTPPLYCGYARGRLGNAPDEVEGQAIAYMDTGNYEDGRIYLHGVWLRDLECARHARETVSPVDYLALRYHANVVQAVMGSTDGDPLQVLVSMDGTALPSMVAGRDVAVASREALVTVAEPRLYALIADVAFGSHVLRLSTASDRLVVYAIAFGGQREASAKVA